MREVEGSNLEAVEPIGVLLFGIGKEDMHTIPKNQRVATLLVDSRTRVV
ncbi:hypothetical protein ACP4OV_013677 [Aristida adscensionis]